MAGAILVRENRLLAPRPEIERSRVMVVRLAISATLSLQKRKRHVMRIAMSARSAQSRWFPFKKKSA